MRQSSPASRDLRGARVVSRVLRAAGLAALVAMGTVAESSFGATFRMRAQAVAEPQAGGKVRVQIEALATQRCAATGRPAVGVTRLLGPGEHQTVYLASGRPDAPDLCDIASLDSPPADLRHTLWTIDVRARDVSGDRTTLKMAWSRAVASTARVEQHHDSRTVSTSPDEYHIVDVARAVDARARCPNLVLRLTAGPANRTLLARPLLTYELWLAYRGTDGQEAVRHAELRGPEQTELPFYLAPLRWRQSGALVETESQEPVIEVAVSGTMHVTRRQDGSLDFIVKLKRWAAWGEGVTGGEGRAVFRAVPGETLVLAVPGPTGQAQRTEPAAPGADSRTAPGVTVSAARVVVDFARFFAGSDFALYLRVRD